ncbi:MAG: dienelactone hydrolase family protein [Acidimicrobiia bacterium]
MPELTRGQYETESHPFELDVDGYGVQAFHARPEGMPTAGVVLIPDMMGIRPLFEDVADRLASNGLAVVVVEPFAFVPPAERPTTVEARSECMSGFDDALMLSACTAAADWLVIHDDVARVSALGFCMGGMYALKCAAAERFDAVVAFYGMVTLPPSWRGPAVRDVIDWLEHAADVSPFLAIFGGRDDFTPASDVERVRKLAAAVPGAEVRVYPEAEHGFTHDPARPTHRGDDAADAWKAALAFVGAAPRALSL